MSLLSFCGKVAVGVSCLIVIAFVILILLAVFCVGLGAYACTQTNMPAQDAQQTYQNVSAKINIGVAGIHGVGLRYYREIKSGLDSIQILYLGSSSLTEPDPVIFVPQ